MLSLVCYEMHIVCLAFCNVWKKETFAAGLSFCWIEVKAYGFVDQGLISGSRGLPS